MRCTYVSNGGLYKLLLMETKALTCGTSALRLYRLVAISLVDHVLSATSNDDRVTHHHQHSAIGVASYGALGHVPLLEFQLFIFSGHFKPHKLTLDSCGCPSRNNILACIALTLFIA